MQDTASFVIDGGKLLRAMQRMAPQQPEARSHSLASMKHEDLRIESYPMRPQKGGQTVGIVETGIRVTHTPTGLVASCGTERSQLRNKRIAMAMIEYGLAEMGWRDS